MSNPLRDMEHPDIIFCIGTNMTECHPVAATRLKKAIANGARMIVADPREIDLAKMCDLFLPIRVGSDVALLLAMAHGWRFANGTPAAMIPAPAITANIPRCPGAPSAKTVTVTPAAASEDLDESTADFFERLSATLGF